MVAALWYTIIYSTRNNNLSTTWVSSECSIIFFLSIYHLNCTVILWFGAHCNFRDNFTIRSTFAASSASRQLYLQSNAIIAKYTYTRQRSFGEKYWSLWRLAIAFTRSWKSFAIDRSEEFDRVARYAIARRLKNCERNDDSPVLDAKLGLMAFRRLVAP